MKINYLGDIIYHRNYSKQFRGYGNIITVDISIQDSSLGTKSNEYFDMFCRGFGGKKHTMKRQTCEQYSPLDLFLISVNQCVQKAQSNPKYITAWPFAKTVKYKATHSEAKSQDELVYRKDYYCTPLLFPTKDQLKRSCIHSEVEFLPYVV